MPYTAFTQIDIATLKLHCGVHKPINTSLLYNCLSLAKKFHCALLYKIHQQFVSTPHAGVIFDEFFKRGAYQYQISRLLSSYI